MYFFVRFVRVRRRSLAGYTNKSLKTEARCTESEIFSLLLVKARGECYSMFNIGAQEGLKRMNTQHLQYIVEIERTRSISQAAENMFIGQPNLSRILHDMEQALGFRIFERSTRGVRPTNRGTMFLQHAKSILRETDAIEALGPRRPVANRLRVSIPRSAAVLELTAQYLEGLSASEPLDVTIRECHARAALEMIAGGETEIGVIRYRSDYQDYFEDQTSTRGLSFELLRKHRYLVTMHRTHPLAGRRSLLSSDLEKLPEIVHGDALRAQGRAEHHRKIYSVDRMAQMELLQIIPEIYLLAPAMPADVLARWDAVQIPCMDNPFIYHDSLIFHRQYAMSEIEQGYVQYIRDHGTNP